ncbi:adenosylhomocysteinase [Cryobacterium mesophilum]|uniref:Adenosylhomocysteinase n=1 Tax=Terrimesophilobacter mesophilus TaxID=433647 RepID=A0A4V3I9Q0_9MICO|nr:adenosylhomocysteinase [Terrimesophilobacter mesophilus]MBB5633611.1 adenosylhomocysteinase [Terrimesophilobacter mesophilus]TFB80308.1 adenosylhomocysteinase [Terrimesophilobacter mesophilus]
MDELVARGRGRIEWIRSRMPLLADARAHFAETRPFAGHRIGMSLHLEPKTAVLLETLAAGGAEVVATGNHGSTQDDVVAVLRASGMTVFGSRDDTLDEHGRNIAGVLDAEPDILLDNGADLAAGIVARGRQDTILGGTEETTSGGLRLRGELAGAIPFPILVINDSILKAIGENRHAVGQSVVESFMRITNLMVPGRRFVVAGYGWCGRGVAQYLRALGGKVAVVEVDELKAFEAALDGYRVDTMQGLATWGEVFITATGHPDVIGPDIFPLLRDGSVLANCGHFPWEIDVAALKADAAEVRTLDAAIERIEFADGRHVILLAEGRMMNLAGREPKGNSLESMDLGFLLQTLSLERIARSAESLADGAQPIPDDINREIARRMLSAMGADR